MLELGGSHAPVPLIIAAVRSVSRCLLPNNYPGAVLTRGKKKQWKKGKLGGL